MFTDLNDRGGLVQRVHPSCENFPHPPVLIIFFLVTSGGQFNIALAEVPGSTYMWGQYTTAREANMYPKPIPDLSGWNIRSIACSGYVPLMFSR
jgi:hypothetical protein